VIRINYFELHDLPHASYNHTPPKSIEFKKLKLEKDSRVVYYPHYDTFDESEDTKIIYVDGIVFVRNYDSMIITMPKKYYSETINTISDAFHKFEVSFKHKYVKLTCNEIVGIEWEYLLKNIRCAYTE
jgi:hypothetical protein